MPLPPRLRTLLVTVAGLCGGVALGTLIPVASPGEPGTQRTRSTTNVGTEGANGGASQSNSRETPVHGVSVPSSRAHSFSDFKEFGSLGKLPPEKLIALFEKVSNLRSETRKYILAYRLASQLEEDQIEGALKAALQDLSDGDYVTTRALARRWAELNPKAAASKALETKQQHLVLPLMESWTRMDPAAPLAWALQQDPAVRADAVRPLLMGRLLDQTQLEKLVMHAGGSETDEMRRQIFPFATTRLADTNPQGALHAASSIDDAELRQRTLIMVMGRLGQSAPELGRSWLASQQSIPPEQKQQLEQVLANAKANGRRSAQ